jgi:hypothetical protein
MLVRLETDLRVADQNEHGGRALLIKGVDCVGEVLWRLLAVFLSAVGAC